MKKRWKDEPDSKDFNAHGFRCALRRGPKSLGHWCGYVGIPETHRVFGLDYDNVPVEVHGGLTYAGDRCPGEKPDGLWWVGFDCAHLGDLVPGVLERDAIGVYPGDEYRDIDFVEREATAVARQLAELATPQQPRDQSVLRGHAETEK